MMGMQRRLFLRLGGLTLLVPVGGCATRDASETSPPATNEQTGGKKQESAFSVRETGKFSVEKRTSAFADPYPPNDKPFVEVVVGEKPNNSENPHGVRIFNEAEERRKVSLTVTTGSDSQRLVFEGDGTISTDTYLSIAIWRPAKYSNKLDVSGEDVNFEKTFEVPQSAWDGGAGEEEGRRSSSQHNVHIRKNEIEVNFVGGG